jgi:aspartate kinase
LIVMKFGGSCLDKPDDIRRMVKILKSTASLQPKAVLSAFKGTTDQLLNQANSAKGGSFDTSEIEAKHQELVDDLPSDIRTQVQPQIQRLLKELRDTLTGVCYLKELSPLILDRVAAYGEKLATHVAAGYLAEGGLKGVPFSDSEAGILTNSNFGNATILEESRQLVRGKLSSVQIPLVAGFFGKDSAGRIATLGRGATDYVATFIAAAFGCRTILYKDVDGVMTADPKLVPNARLISDLDYATAIELGRYGSKVVFEKAIVPAMIAKTAIEVKPFEKEENGTLISGEGAGEATSYMKDMAMVQVSGIHGLNVVGSILSGLDQLYPDDPITVAPLFRNEMALITNESRSDKVADAIRRIGGDVTVNVRKGFSLVAVIGMRFQQPRVYESLRKAGVEPTIVIKTPSGMTTCAIVDQEETDTSVRALHEELLAS